MGFVSFPDVSFTADPSGLIASGQGYYTLAEPVLRSGFLEQPATWDSPFSRWVPVNHELLAPDGHAYAWTDVALTPAALNKVHVVDVTTGQDLVVLSANNLVAVSYQTDAIYLVKGRAEEAGYQLDGGGLWRLDIADRKLREIAPESSGVWVNGPAYYGAYIANGAAWAAQATTTGKGAVVRLDLDTGSQTIWFSRSSSEVVLIGIDQAGFALVSVDDPPFTEIWTVTASQHATLVYRGRDAALGPGGLHTEMSSFVDNHGLWFSAFARPDRVFLYRAGGLVEVPSLGWDDNVHAWYPAGPCQDIP